MVKKKTEKTGNAGSFLDDFLVETKGMKGVATSAPPPKYWLNTGNAIINKTISPSYNKGIGTGRIMGFTGPSDTGKSYLLANLIKSALNSPKDQPWAVMVLDSERALDEAYMDRIGANWKNNPLYLYRGISTISDSLNLASKFVAAYKARNEDMPALIAIDSMDQLMTDSEEEQYESGQMKGDQGQQAKQIKGMLKRLVQDISETNIAIANVKQAYQEQDKIKAYQNPWVVTQSWRFAQSQIALVTKLLLKNEDKDNPTKEKFKGITLKVYGFKTRFTKPYQTAVVDLPWATGMDYYSGVLEAAESLGIVTKPTTQSYEFDGKRFKKTEIDDYKEAILNKLTEFENEDLNVSLDEYTEDMSGETGKEVASRRKTQGNENEETVENSETSED